MLEADPPRRLSYTWHAITPEFAAAIGGDEDRVDGDGRRAAVARHVRHRAGRVDGQAHRHARRLRARQRRAGDGVSQGWPSILSSLKTLLETTLLETECPDCRRADRSGPVSGLASCQTSRWPSATERRRSADAVRRIDRAACERSCWGACRSPSPRTTERSPRTVSDFLAKHQSRAAARALLEADDEPNASFYKEAADLGWLGLHVPEELGGSGYGLEETVVVVEELGRALAPGAFVPTLIASAVLVAAGTDDVQGAPAARPRRRLDARRRRRSAATSTRSDGKLLGSAGTVLGAGLADVHPRARRRRRRRRRRQGRRRHRRDAARTSTPTRRSGRVTLDGATGDILPGARRALTDIARTILAAEAVGVARESTDLAAEYAKVRLQFGRPIAMFQAVKHHCANMAVATELATAAVWDAARAAAGGGDQFSYAAAVAAALAVPAADECANLGMQVHGGIGFTWEHDCHVYLRRATAIGAVLDADDAAADVDRPHPRRRAAASAPSTCRPRPSAIRDDVRPSSPSSQGLDDDAASRPS